MHRKKSGAEVTSGGDSGCVSRAHGEEDVQKVLFLHQFIVYCFSTSCLMLFEQNKRTCWQKCEPYSWPRDIGCAFNN